MITATEISETATTKTQDLATIQSHEIVLDIGPKTVQNFKTAIQESKTVVLNGPMGMYELPPFANGTKNLFEHISNSSAIRIIGGGDTIDAITKFKIDPNKFNHISTGGGAMIEFLEGQTLPGITPLLN